MTRERKILRKIWQLIFEKDYWNIKMNQEIYNKFKFPHIVTVINMKNGLTWACCKNEWQKDGEEVTGRQTGKREKKITYIRWMSNWA